MIGMSIKRISVLNLCHVLKPFVKSTPGRHEPRHMKTFLRGFRPCKAKTGLLSSFPMCGQQQRRYLKPIIKMIIIIIIIINNNNETHLSRTCCQHSRLLPTREVHVTVWIEIRNIRFGTGTFNYSI